MHIALNRRRVGHENIPTNAVKRIANFIFITKIRPVPCVKANAGMIMTNDVKGAKSDAPTTVAITEEVLPDGKGLTT